MKKRNTILTYLIGLLALISLTCNLPSLSEDKQFTINENPTSTNIPIITDSALLPTVPSQSSIPITSTPQTTQSQTQIGENHSWPDTWSGIHVFNDQLASWSMTDAQWVFAAEQYDGTQKMTRSDADRLRSINPNFIILHYRLGIGLGYQIISDNCQPGGEWINIIEGENWIQEWPGDENVNENWFFHWPQDSTTRVLNCDWGWYLADLDASDWREYWHGEVLRQVQANGNDGVFMDSLSVPNFLGYDHYKPNLPEVEASFEGTWATRINDLLTWLQGQPLGDYALIPNAGNWITGRDITDYSAADGVMIEGFALEADESPYNLEDWQLEMDRTLNLISQHKIVLAQSSAYGDQERMFITGSYLLIKGHSTYLNIELDLEPEWWPEYDIPIGAPIDSGSNGISDLYDAGNQVYRRNFDNGFVLVNPTSPWDGSEQTITINLDGTYYLAQTIGGGNISEEGVPSGQLSYQAVDSVTLPSYSAAILFNEQP